MTQRCAVYTRKSSEEGLDQSFNSLDAQREACEAYVKSQTHEGWRVIKTAYDDGGFSGGNLERPALKQLLADIAAGQIDVVVVYKIDRLTRSLMDFAKIVDAFDAKSVSFVSVTQAFNTTTSMGRLTLNVLLSFAQFEREVTGERIRDKIAASKAKGMWMGGTPPLGYDGGDHTLVVNPPEAETVRHIFRRYLELGSVYKLRDELKADGIFSKRWTNQRGEAKGGEPFYQGALFHLLQNRHYRGEIAHKDKVYPGLHPAIVDKDLFDQAQALLAANRAQLVARRGKAKQEKPRARLAGRVFDFTGAAMSPTFGYGKQGRRYRYYVSQNLIKRRGRPRNDAAPQRLPADPLEALALGQLQRISGRQGEDWDALEALLVRMEVRAEEAHFVLDASALYGDEHPELGFEAATRRISPTDRLLIEPGKPARLRLVLPVRLAFRGGRTWVEGEAPRVTGRPDPELVKMLKTAHGLLASAGCDLVSGAPIDLSATADVTKPQRRLCGLALLSPAIQQMILEGRQPAGLTQRAMIENPPPLDWAEMPGWLEQVTKA